MTRGCYFGGPHLRGASVEAQSPPRGPQQTLQPTEAKGDGEGQGDRYVTKYMTPDVLTL